MTRTLADAGADVAIHYHGNRQKAEELQKEVISMGRRAMIVQADVRDQQAVNAMRDAVVAELGAPHIVINNAVVQYQWTSVLEQNPADYVSQFESCVMHNLYMAKAFVPAMIERGGGRFVGISTDCAMTAAPTQSAYVAGKRGMDGLYRVLAKEVGQHGITVNLIAPGWTVSDRDRENGTEESPDYAKNIPLRRRGTDQEIANAVAFIASDLASFITGAYIPVCGGYVMPAI
jgi:3-oxoacyl-[acyl-carrier protein] reductase